MRTLNIDKKLLKDIIIIEKGKMPLEQPYYGKDADLYLNPDYLRGRAVAESVKPSSNAVKVSDGEIVLLWDGSNAGEVFKSKKGILASTMSRITHPNSFNTDFLYYSLKNWESFLKGQTSGSGIPHVDKEILGKIEIMQFRLEEQDKIAEVLKTMDRAISHKEALIAKQERIKIGLMQVLLTKGIDDYGNIRSEDTHEFKDSPIGRIPVEWEVDIMQNCSKVIDSLHRTPSFIEDGYPMVRITDIKKGVLSLDTCVKVEKSVFDEFTCNHKPLKGDIVMSRVGTYGISSIVYTDEKFCIGQNTVVITEHENSDFLFEFLQTPVVRAFFDLQLAGSSQKTLSLKAIRETPVPILSLEEMDRIVVVLKGTEDYNETLRMDLKKLKYLKTALMQDLLTGKKRVTALL